VQPRFLIVETSGRVGQVALARGDTILEARRLDELRRHARDLAPATHDLLTRHGWRARDLDAVIVSRGPGSYTGLRVGLMSAKTLAYATGCAILAVDTFQAIHQNVAQKNQNVDVIADAQQNNIYVQRFGPNAQPLVIVPLETWLASALEHDVAVTGPGVELFAGRLPAGLTVLPPETAQAQPASLLEIGLARFLRGERDDPFVLEPLYCRPSSAQEKWDKLHPRQD